MLKFTYTETEIRLEYLNQSLEELISRRFILAMRVGGRLVAEPGTGSFLLPANFPLLNRLTTIARLEENLAAPCPVDTEFVEISLRGTWLSTGGEGGDGIFLVELGDYAERLILEICRTCFSLESLRV